MRKFMCLGIAAVWLSGCQQLPLGGTPQLQGKFIDSSRAKPLELDAVTENPLLNNGVIEVLAGNRESSATRPLICCLATSTVKASSINKKSCWTPRCRRLTSPRL